jgi:uridine kinase
MRYLTESRRDASSLDSPPRRATIPGSEGRAVRNILIGVAGGTGSGKTTVTRAVTERFGPSEVVLLEQDFYYKRADHLPFEERARINYDHPDAFDTDLLIEHVGSLVAGAAIEKPSYDFVAHNRRADTIHVEPAHVIILEGILVLENPRLRELMDIKLFVDTEADVRILRRLRRDMTERGRSFDSVIDQYLKTVRPMHLQFVEPSKRYADLIIPEGGQNRVAFDMLVAKIEYLLRKVPSQPTLRAVEVVA